MPYKPAQYISNPWVRELTIISKKKSLPIDIKEHIIDICNSMSALDSKENLIKTLYYRVLNDYKCQVKLIELLEDITNHINSYNKLNILGKYRG